MEKEKEEELENRSLLNSEIKKNETAVVMEQKKDEIETPKSTKFRNIVLLITFCFIFTAIVFLLIVIIVIFIIVESFGGSDLKKAKYLASRTPLIDGHNDLATKIHEIVYEDKIPFKFHLDRKLSNEEATFLKQHGYTLQTDIAMMKEGYQGGQIWAVYTDCRIMGKESVERALEQFSIIHEMDEYYDDFQEVVESKDISHYFNKNKLLSFFGVEGGQMIDSNLRILHDYKRLGSIYLTLTHNCNTEWADSCCDPAGFVHNGLTEFGKTVIAEMNRIGMIVDLSHTSVKTMEDTLAITKAPIMFSHSNVFSLCHHLRNVPDHIIDKVKENNGIIMVTFVASFVSEAERIAQVNMSKSYSGKNLTAKIFQWEENHPSDRATLKMIADHLDYIKRRIGINHVGIGSDFDGTTFVPLGLEDASKHIFLIEELVKRGYSSSDVKKVLSKNFKRVLSDVEKVSKDMKSSKIFSI